MRNIGYGLQALLFGFLLGFGPLSGVFVSVGPTSIDPTLNKLIPAACGLAFAAVYFWMRVTDRYNPEYGFSAKSREPQRLTSMTSWTP